MSYDLVREVLEQNHLNSVIKWHFNSYIITLKKNILILFLFSIVLPAYSQDFKGTMIRIIDGDTYVFQTRNGSFTVRMCGTDAPERDQPFAKESADYLKQYLNKDGTLKRQGIDKSDRTLGRLIINDQDTNLLPIRGGYSWHFKRYSSDQDYASAEEYARMNKLGLWGIINPLVPWEWRGK